MQQLAILAFSNVWVNCVARDASVMFLLVHYHVHTTVHGLDQTFLISSSFAAAARQTLRVTTCGTGEYPVTPLGLVSPLRASTVPVNPSTVSEGAVNGLALRKCSLLATVRSCWPKGKLMMKAAAMTMMHVQCKPRPVWTAFILIPALGCQYFSTKAGYVA
jgi:hypothetical protein